MFYRNFRVLPAILLLCLSADAKILSADTVTRSTIANLETWPRTELAFSSATRPARRYVAQSNRDFHAALERNRRHVVTSAGGTSAYAPTMSLSEAKIFKGFSFEQSLIRRLNSKLTGPRFRPADRGHLFADIEQFDPVTGKMLQTLQAYGGTKPRAAIEKLLLSDSAADKLIVPRDIFDLIKNGISEVKAIWNKMQTGEIDPATGMRQIRRRAAKFGLKCDESTGELYANSRAHGRGTLGRLGTPEIDTQLGRLVRDRLTSDQVELNQWKAQLDSDTKLRGLWERLGGDDDAARALQKLYDEHKDGLVKSGVRLAAR
jgi:hypothetical protein